MQRNATCDGVRERAPRTLSTSPWHASSRSPSSSSSRSCCSLAVGAYAWDSSKLRPDRRRGDDRRRRRRRHDRRRGDRKAVDTRARRAAAQEGHRRPTTGVKYQLSPEKLEVDSDVDGMVDQALEESQEGGLPTRVWRYATGGEVDVAISPQVSYSNQAIDEFVAKVADEVNTDPVNATIEPTLGLARGRRRPRRDRGRRGRAARADRVRGPAHRPPPGRASRSTRSSPEVTKADLAEQYPTYLTVDESTFTLTLWKDLKLAKKYTVAVGQPAYPTPTGLYSIESKQVDPVWSVPNSPWAGELGGTDVAGGTAENPLKARWMGITDGAGFHGTDEVSSLGTAASHGCVRMAVPDVDRPLRPGRRRHPDLHRLSAALRACVAPAGVTGASGEATRAWARAPRCRQPRPIELELSPAWEAALEAYARELTTRGRVAVDAARLRPRPARARAPGRPSAGASRASSPIATCAATRRRSPSAGSRRRRRPQARRGARLSRAPGRHRRS